MDRVTKKDKYAIGLGALFLAVTAANFYLELAWFGRFGKAAVATSVGLILYAVLRVARRQQ
jgi:hypothetical protein